MTLFFVPKPAFFEAFSWDSAKVVKMEHIDKQDQNGIISGPFWCLGDVAQSSCIGFHVYFRCIYSMISNNLQVIQPRGYKNNGKGSISIWKVAASWMSQEVRIKGE